MRPLLALLALLPLAACAGTLREWEKPGVDREAARHDLGECRRAASAEAFRMQSDFGFSGFPRFRPGYSARPDYFFRQQGFYSDRVYDEQRLAMFCMRNKGYELTPVQTEEAPPTPVPPRSP